MFIIVIPGNSQLRDARSRSCPALSRDQAVLARAQYILGIILITPMGFLELLVLAVEATAMFAVALFTFRRIRV